MRILTGILILTLLLAIALVSDSTAAHISHHRVEARLEPATAWLDVVDDVSFRLPGETDRTAPIHLVLARELELRSADASLSGSAWHVFPSADAAFFTPDPDSLDRAALRRAQEIVLSPPPDTGWPETFRVVFRYAGAIYDSLREPATPYARSFPTSEGLIDTAGTYLAGSSLWVPSELNDLFSFELTADIPAGWHSMSQGSLTDSLVAGGRRRETWRSPEPMQEIYFVAGGYTIERAPSAGPDGIEMLTYLYHPEPDLSAKYLEATRRAIEKYSRLLGPYPFRKFALVENWWQSGFGMPSFTLLGDRVIRLPFIVDTSYPHEILHNWWGNGVFVDHRLGNWCEGLTTYGADYLSKEEKSAAEARDYRRGVLIDYRNYVRERNDFPLEKFSGRTDPVTQNVGYGKGMMVFHMLRRRLGDDLFWGGLRRFYQGHLFRPTGWRDVIGAFEEESGRDLGGFYAQWIARPGAPSLTLESAATSRKGSSYQTRFVLRQAGEAAYQLDIPVVLRGESAETTLVVALGGDRVTGTVDTPWKPRSLAADPGFDCFRQVDRREIPATLSQSLGADSALVVLAAGLPQDLEVAYRTLAESWRGGGMSVRLVEERDVTPAELRRHAAWIFGQGALESRLMKDLAPGLAGHAELTASSWSIEGAPYDAAGHTLVLTVPSPDTGDLAWTFLVSRDAASLAPVGEKLRHYGKYSYLVFEGDRNVSKGTLDPVASPLEARF